VNAQLIDTESGAHLWADRFDTDRANLPEAQNEITSRLARTVDLELVKDVSRRIEQEKAINPDARDLVMRGWAWRNQPASKENRLEALSTHWISMRALSMLASVSRRYLSTCSATE
jgi:adenylate cyclase